MIQPLVSAARVVCYLNGRRAGTVTRFGHTSETPTHELGGLDSFDPFELAPTSTKVSGTVGLYRIAGLGGVEGMGLTAQYEALSRQKYATVQLLDRLTGAQLGVTVCSLGLGIVAEPLFSDALMAVSASFWRDDISAPVSSGTKSFSAMRP